MRWFGLVDDPTTGGSTFGALAAMAAGTPAIAAPTQFVPVTTADADPGEVALDRDNEVRGTRGNTAPQSFASAPSMSLEARAYPRLLRKLLRIALGGPIATTGGTAGSAYVSTVGPLQSGSLPAIICWLLREGQLDRLAGAVVEEFTLNFPIDEEGTISATLQGLYHDVDGSTGAVDPNGAAAAALPAASYTGHDDTFMLRDAVAVSGSGLVELPDFAGLSLTFNNGLIADMRSRFRPNRNIETVTVDGVRHRVWYPNRHKLGAQTVTGRLDLSDVNPTRDQLRKLRHAEKLVVDISAGPLATTPPADEMVRLTLYRQAPLSGGAEAIQREGDQVASYEFGAYLSPTDANKDIEATFTGATALT